MGLVRLHPAQRGFAHFSRDPAVCNRNPDHKPAANRSFTVKQDDRTIVSGRTDSMSDFDESPRRPSISIATLKIVAIVGLLSWLATAWLSDATRDYATLGRLAANVSRGSDDPLTTGSIGKRMETTRLDPCTGNARR